MQNRRDFLKNTLASTALIGLGGLCLSSFTIPTQKRITIIHTNDTHSQIDPLPNYHSKYPGLGGFKRRATLINQIKKENSNMLLLDAGDIFQGTPYFNSFGGKLELKLMNTLGYDLATLGNHDFDIGIEALHKQLPNINFDFVSANYNFSNTLLDGFIKPYSIFWKDEIKVGVFGLGIQLEGLAHANLYQETKYLDPITITQDIVFQLKKVAHCDLIICLSHLGYNYNNQSHQISDLKLAQQTKDIDLIIGGHTHTLLPKPTVIKNKVGADVIINQCGKNGIFMGQIDFYFTKNGNKFATSQTHLV